MDGDTKEKQIVGRRLGSDALTGLVVGLVEAVLATSIGGLIYTGLGTEGIDRGVGFALVGAAVSMAWIGWRSGTTGTMGALQATVAAVTAAVVASVAEASSPDRAIPTAVVLVALSSVLVGLIYGFAGRLRLAQLIRFVPFPVVGGFLAGSGFLLARGGLSLMVGNRVAWSDVPDLFSSETIRLWVPGLLLAGLVLAARRRFADRPWVLPGALVLALGVFWTATLLTGSVETAEAGGWLLGPFETVPRWAPVTLTDMADADWGAIAGQVGGLVTIVVIAVVSLLFSVSSLEIMRGSDTDVDTEFRLAGGSNVVAGLLGGPVGHQSVIVTLVSRYAGGTSRTVSFVAGAVCLGVGLFGGQAVSLVPRLVLGAVLLMLGGSLLFEWLVRIRARLPAAEYFVVVVIVAVVALYGVIPGVAVGIAAAAGLFAFTYSRTEAVKHQLSGAEHQSRVTRPPGQVRELRSAGHQISILEMQGFIFFGSAHQVLETVRRRASDAEQDNLSFVVVDFRLVRGIDSSAALSFSKLQRLAASLGFTLVLTSVAEAALRSLEQGGFDFSATGLRVLADLDHGLEWCEDQLLARADVTGIDDKEGSSGLLGALLSGGGAAQRFQRYVTRCEVSAGETLIRQGDHGGEMYAVVSGSLTVQLQLGGGRVSRLARVGPGAVVGEMGLYTGSSRTASVIAATDSIVECLTEESLVAMERDDPDLAASTHRAIVVLLSERLARANDAVRSLLE